MPANNAARLLNKLEQARSQIGTMKERELVRLLSAAGRVTFGKDAKSLIRFHDLLLFFRAFPPGLAVLRLSERLLESFEPRGKAALAGGADADDFAPEEVVGIAGTVVEATFSYPMVCWLVQRHAKSISIQWDDYDRETQRAVIWPRFFPLVEEDSLTEANVPYLEWLKAARGRQDELPWLVRQFQRLPLSEKEKAALYDSLEIMVRWDMSSSRASRTLSRKPVKEFYFHREPLIQRRQVSLTDEFAKPRLPIKVLPPREAEKMLDLVKEATGVRYRELYGTSNADPKWVAQANPGRGVEIYFWGLPPEMRLPLRAYLAGFSVTNGISVYPYQIGDGNEEAIGSGAFWFYRKMGFRSMNPELEKAAQSEEKKVQANASYRTPARTLRRLSKGHVVYELPEAEQGAWDRFAMRNVGFAAQRRMARDFDGDAEAMRKVAVERLAHIIKVNPQKLKSQAQGAFADFATVLSLVPDVSRWSSDDKDALREIIAAKAGPNELRYQRLLQSHPRLRAAILRLGSQKL